MLVFVILAAFVTAETKRWPEEFAAARSSSEGLPSLKPGVEKCLAAAEAFEAAEHKGTQEAARDEYSRCLPGLGPNTNRFFARSGGLGKITQNILGPAAFLELLRKTPASVRDRAGLASMTAEAFYNNGEFEKAEKASIAALKLNPNDQAAFAILKLSQGRSKNKEPTAVVAQAPAVKTEVKQSNSKPSQLPLSIRTVAQPPPSITLPPSPIPPNGIQSDMLGAQLAGPLLVKSNENPVSKKYLSPILEAGVPIRFANPNNAWGSYDPRTGVIELNMALINGDLTQLNAHRGTAIPLIAANSRLTPDQINHLTTRFMPLILHEVGGHAKNGNDLRRLMKTNSSPLTLDTEVFAWRIHCLYIEIEQRKDPAYLNDPAPWASFQQSAMGQWRRSRHERHLNRFVNYLRAFPAYADLPYARSSSFEFMKEALTVVHNHCRHRFDQQECPQALIALTGMYDTATAAPFLHNIGYLQANPTDDVVRGQMVNRLLHDAIVFYRLDKKSAETSMRYYKDREFEVDRLQRKVAPISLMERMLP